jgi:hypothetical protein
MKFDAVSPLPLANPSSLMSEGFSTLDRESFASAELLLCSPG